jgi:hypothetical protein
MNVELESRIVLFDFEKCQQYGMLYSAELPTNFKGLSWWVLNVTTDDLRFPSKIFWATPTIMNRILARYVNNNLVKLESIIAKQLLNPSLLELDGEFQYWACAKIASGVALELSKPAYVGNECKLEPFDKSITLPALEMRAT